MHFTREPTVETVVTPREGCKLVVRSSRGVSKEEYFVDAVEVVAFGTSSFFRSLEKPKAFLLPVSDYEILEVRETRMALKTSLPVEKKTSLPVEKKTKKEPPAPKVEQEKSLEKKRERRRQRRRKGGEDDDAETPAEELPKPKKPPLTEEKSFEALLPPPDFLISDKMEKAPAKMKKAPAKPASEVSEPQLVPPEEGSAGWSPGKLFRKLRGSEEKDEE